MMTRTDYKKIANVIGRHYTEINYDFIEELMEVFADDNPKFNPKLFMEAVEQKMKEGWERAEKKKIKRYKSYDRNGSPVFVTIPE
jgi:hypothetical protein